MKKVILLLIIASYSLFSGELKTNYSAADSTIKIDYSDNSRLFENNAKLTAIAYIFDNFSKYPEAISIPLNLNEKGNYIADYTLTNSGYLFALIKIGDDKNYDTKNFEFYDVIFTNKNNSIKQNTYYKIGLTYYGTIAPNIKRSVDLNKAGDYFEKELSLFPENIYAKIALNSLKYENSKEMDEKYYNFLSSLVKNFDVNNADDYSTLNAIRILKATGKEDKANQIESAYAKNNPTSLIADQIEFDKIKKLNSQKKFNEFVVNYLKTFPKSQNYEKAFLALMDSYVMTDNFATFDQICRNLNGLTSTIITKVVDKLEDKSLGFELIKYVYKNFDSFKDKKESYLTEIEYQNQVQFQKLILMESIVSHYYTLLDPEFRDEIFSNNFLPIANLASDKFLDAFIDNNKSKLKYGNSIEMIEEMLNTYNANSEKLLSLHKELYNSIYKNLDGYDSYFAKVIANKKARALKSLQFDSYNTDLNDALVQNSANDMVNLKFYKGKIVIVEFWSTWISSSELIITSVDSLLNAMNLNDDVVFIPLSVWEKDKDSKSILSKFMTDNNLQRNLYYDSDNSVPYNAGITGIPARIFIDKSGKIRFLENGFTDIESYTENLKLKLEFLK